MSQPLEPPPARAAKPPRRPRRRDREILDAAVEVFARRGYVQASVQDVADAVGLLKGSLYHYIDSKDDLLFRLLDEVHDEVDAVLAEVQAVPGLAPLERLGLYVERQVAYNTANLAQISIYYHDVGHLSEEHRKDIAARRRVHERFVAELIRQAQADGDADPELDPKLAANCVFATIIWTYRWFKPERMDAAEVARHCGRFAAEGLRVPR
jgi:AcrR family transcriptional regulator